MFEEDEEEKKINNILRCLIKILKVFFFLNYFFLKGLNKRYNETKYAEHSNQSNNIILTPVKPITILNSTNSSSGINNNSSNNNSNNNNNNHSNKGVIRVTTISCNSNNNNNNISIKSSPNTSDSIIKSKSNSNINYLSYEPDTNRAVDFTDAQLIIERDQQGKKKKLIRHYK